MKCLLPCGILLALFTTAALAKDFENGDFAKGKNGWLGDGKVVYLDAAGAASETQTPGSIPAVAIDLSKTQFKEITQKFETPEGTGALTVEVTYKASPDFKLNDKSSKFTKDNSWSPGTTWYWSGLVFPKVDLCIRLDKPDGYSYRLSSVQPGSDWKTLHFRWDNVGSKKDVKLSVIVPPGDGMFYLRSVAVAK